MDGYNNAGATGISGIGRSSVQPISGEGLIWSNNGGVGTWDANATFTIAIYVEGTPAPVPVPYWAIALLFVAVGIGTYFTFRKKMVKQAI